MQQLPEFKAADLTRHTSELFDAAIRSPVAITKHRKPRYVLMTYDEFEAMKTRGDPRRVYGANEAPQELVDIIMPERDRLIAEGRETDG